MKKDRRNLLILVLIFIIIILLGIIAYIFLVRPALNGLIILGYNQGVISSVAYLIQEAGKCQPIPVTLKNQTVNLIAIDCLQQPT